jgi:putative membrane protein
MPDAKLPDDPSSDELADTRTAWAEDRTVLANERTFAGWMRTGMACVALALGLKAVFKDSDHTLIAKGAAEVFILAAVLIFWSAVNKCRQAKKRMDEHDVEGQSQTRMLLLALILTFGALVTGAILWLL